ncbi:DoxX family protein [Shouchella patagoniensis]|uniref:DoxX family protein n=1 Tax=Shouchella patagoniensis TaxID=228576 RepID=UPI0009950835|nr:DoxX family protein [Shouchella patagoniensis]
MFTHYLTKSNVSMVGLLFVRLYLGWQWFSSGLGKITGDGFNASGFLAVAVENPVRSGSGAIAYPWYNSFIETIVLPNAEIFSFIVMWGELLVGLGLIVGLFTTTAAFFGGTMNVSFMLAGTVSTNPIMLLLAILLMIGKGKSGAIGLDSVVKQIRRKKQDPPMKKELEFVS